MMGKNVSMRVTAVVKYSKLTWLQQFPDNLTPLKVGNSDRLCMAPDFQTVLKVNAATSRRPRGTHNALTPSPSHIQPSVFICALVPPQPRGNTWTLPLSP